MKNCGKCKEDKDDECFASHPKKKLQTFCRECQKEYRRTHYLNNKKKYIEKASLWNKEFTKWWREYKSLLKCETCEENHPACLQFHHHEDNKEECVAKFIANKQREKALEEVKKCIVLCANCHFKLHDKLKNAL